MSLRNTRLHPRQQRILAAVTDQPARCASIAARVHLDYDQTDRLLTELSMLGYAQRADNGVWTATDRNT